jgi:hypothetical protein
MAQVERLEQDGRVVWRKRFVAERGRGPLLFLLRGFARLSGIESLLPPASGDAAAACATEARMIERLQALRVRVPDILDLDATRLDLADLGGNFAQHCKRQKDPVERERLVALGFAALADLHARGGCVNQAFARNLAWDGERIGFIDLEQDPLTVMSLEAAQARDLLLYAYSTARFFPGEPGRYLRLLRQQRDVAPREVLDRMDDALRRLAWLAPLSFLLGRDLGSFAALVGAHSPQAAARWRAGYLVAALLLLLSGAWLFAF